jgi:hypothetical protein
MALGTRIAGGPGSGGSYREVWQETDPDNFDGGTDDFVYTDIMPINPSRLSPEVDFTDTYLFVDLAIGNPVIPDPEVSIVNGKVRVRLRNTAAAGNKAAWTLRVKLNVGTER